MFTLCQLVIILTNILIQQFVASSFVDDSLCSIVAATNINSLKSYEQWNCTLNVVNSDPCLWTGVHCNTTDIYSIVLSGISLSGSIPTDLFGLSTLSSLDISTNKLKGMCRVIFVSILLR